jgi:hypothetical protein
MKNEPTRPEGQRAQRHNHQAQNKTAFPRTQHPSKPPARRGTALRRTIPSFTVTFTAAPGSDGIRGLRGLLKISLRKFGLHCVDAREVRR